MLFSQLNDWLDNWPVNLECVTQSSASMWPTVSRAKESSNNNQISNNNSQIFVVTTHKISQKHVAIFSRKVPASKTNFFRFWSQKASTEQDRVYEKSKAVSKNGNGHNLLSVNNNTRIQIQKQIHTCAWKPGRKIKGAWFRSAVVLVVMWSLVKHAEDTWSDTRLV